MIPVFTKEIHSYFIAYGPFTNYARNCKGEKWRKCAMRDGDGFREQRAHEFCNKYDMLNKFGLLMVPTKLGSQEVCHESNA